MVLVVFGCRPVTKWPAGAMVVLVVFGCRPVTKWPAGAMVILLLFQYFFFFFVVEIFILSLRNEDWYNSVNMMFFLPNDCCYFVANESQMWLIKILFS